jgi:hypothetical protein
LNTLAIDHERLKTTVYKQKFSLCDRINIPKSTNTKTILVPVVGKGHYARFY